MYPPSQLMIQMYSIFFLLLLWMYLCVDLFTNVDKILFGNKLIEPVYFICVVIYMYRYMF